MANSSISLLIVAVVVASYLASSKSSKSHNDRLVPKYAVYPTSKLEALFRLDLEIYKNVVRLFPPKLGANPIPAESLVLNYLQDFQETVGDFFKSGANEAEIIGKAVRNQLAIYRTLWRFENYIKEITRLPAEDIGTAFKGE